MAARAVLMVRPCSFGFNAETAASNAFQHDDAKLTRAAIQTHARAEFDGLATQLRAHGVEVICCDDTPEPPKPDAVFPNNWLSMHANGDIVLYPMSVPSRRAEVRRDIVATLTREHGFECREMHDLSDPAVLGGVLEGTGSLVLDSDAQLAFACLSARTEAPAVQAYSRRFSYEPVVFRASDRTGVSIYHTNVLMMLGGSFAVVCLDAIERGSERRSVIQHIEASAREVIEITPPEMHSFGANLLELKGDSDTPLLVGSEAAFAGMRTTTRTELARRCTLISTPLPTIERYGGGSARCMLAEIGLPRV
jgi:hypothetical protein